MYRIFSLLLTHIFHIKHMSVSATRIVTKTIQETTNWRQPTIRCLRAMSQRKNIRIRIDGKCAQNSWNCWSAHWLTRNRNTLWVRQNRGSRTSTVGAYAEIVLWMRVCRKQTASQCRELLSSHPVLNQTFIGWSNKFIPIPYLFVEIWTSHIHVVWLCNSDSRAWTHANVIGCKQLPYTHNLPFVYGAASISGSSARPCVMFVFD